MCHKIKFQLFRPQPARWLTGGDAQSDPSPRRSGGTKASYRALAAQRGRGGLPNWIPPKRTRLTETTAAAQQRGRRARKRPRSPSTSPGSARSAGSGAPETPNTPTRKVVAQDSEETCENGKGVSPLAGVRFPRARPLDGRRARASMTAISGRFVRFRRTPVCCQSLSAPEARRRRSQTWPKTSLCRTQGGERSARAGAVTGGRGGIEA